MAANDEELPSSKKSKKTELPTANSTQQTDNETRRRQQAEESRDAAIKAFEELKKECDRHEADKIGMRTENQALQEKLKSTTQSFEKKLLKDRVTIARLEDAVSIFKYFDTERS